MGYLAILVLTPAVLFGAYHAARRIDDWPGRRSVWMWAMFVAGLVAVVVVLQAVGWLPVSEPVTPEG